MNPVNVLSVSILLASFISTRHTDGVMTLLPSMRALVCNGDEFELLCTIDGEILEWSFNIIPGNSSTPRHVSRLLESSQRGAVNSSLQVNSTMFTFSRISPPNMLPLVSKLSLSFVTEGLNGTVITCSDRLASNMSSTIIYVTDSEQCGYGHNVSITPISWHYGFLDVIVTLEWMQDFCPGVQYITNVVPKIELGTARVQLMVPYNTLYNFSVEVVYPCQRKKIVSFIELYFSKCGYPDMESNSFITVTGYKEPALENSTVSFSCSPGLSLNGPYSAICMNNGNWEPDPRSIRCNNNFIMENKEEILIKATVPASVVVFVASSITLLVVGYLCGHFCRRKTPSESTSAQEQSPIPLYEDITPQQPENYLDLNTNEAYGQL